MPKYAVCHPDRLVVSKGLCNSCYLKSRYIPLHQRTTRASNCTHTDRPEAGKGLCKSCYCKAYSLIAPRAVCHPDRPNWTKGKCQSCYVMSKERERKLIEMGLNELKIELIAKAQRYLCAICQKDITSSTWNIDHDHENGAARGLLCKGCNSALGHFGDNVVGVLKVLEYLNNPPAGIFVDWNTVNYSRHIRTSQLSYTERKRRATAALAL